MNRNQFGERIRELRKDRGLTLRDLSVKVGVGFTYLSKIENQKLDFGMYPGEDLICKLAEALNIEGDELLLLAEKIPMQIRQRVFERPDVFQKVASLDDKHLDRLMKTLDA